MSFTSEHIEGLRKDLLAEAAKLPNPEYGKTTSKRDYAGGWSVELRKFHNPTAGRYPDGMFVSVHCDVNVYAEPYEVV